MNRPATHRQTAFSLIEMLAVVMILAIASAIVLSQFSSHDDLKLSSAARQLTADLLFVQNRAVSTGKTHYIVFDIAKGNYEAMESIDPPIRLTHPDLQKQFHIDVGSGALSGVSIQSANFDGEPIVAFDALGTPYQYSSSTHVLSSMKNGAIVLSCGSQSITVTVTPFTGAIKVK